MNKILSFEECLNLSHKQTLSYYRNYVNKGLATLCIGGGMGIAMCIER